MSDKTDRMTIKEIGEIWRNAPRPWGLADETYKTDYKAEWAELTKDMSPEEIDILSKLNNDDPS